MRRSPAVGEVLLCSVLEPGHERREGLRSRLPGRLLPGLHQGARAHRITAAVHRFLAGVDRADPGQQALLSKDADAAFRRHLRALVDLGTVHGVLTDAGIPWMVIKGPVLAQELYRDDALRTYADLDLVVPRHEFGRAVARLLEAGMPLVRTDWTRATQELAGELCLVGPAGTSIDLHWDLVYHRLVRDRARVDVAGLFERSVPVRLGATTTRTLDPVDTVLHLALHAARGGGGRLQWVKDLERATSVGRPDWDELVTRARRWRLALVAAVMLDRARSVLGADVPPAVLDALGGRTWRHLIRATERVRPIERSAGRSSVSTMLVRGTGGSARGSVLPMARQVRAALRRPAGPPAAVQLQRSVDEPLERFLVAVCGPEPALGSLAARERSSP